MVRQEQQQGATSATSAAGQRIPDMDAAVPQIPDPPSHDIQQIAFKFNKNIQNNEVIYLHLPKNPAACRCAAGAAAVRRAFRFFGFRLGDGRQSDGDRRRS